MYLRIGPLICRGFVSSSCDCNFGGCHVWYTVLESVGEVPSSVPVGMAGGASCHAAATVFLRHRSGIFMFSPVIPVSLYHFWCVNISGLSADCGGWRCAELGYFTNF